MRHYLHPGRDIVEDTSRLTIEDLRAMGFIPRAGLGYVGDNAFVRTGIITLSRNGERSGSLGVKVHMNGGLSYIEFNYVLGDEKKTVAYEHGLELFPCHFGGYRYFIRCRHCYRRVTALYLSGGYYACRHCQSLAYEGSQTHGTLSEKIDRAWSLRARAKRLKELHHPRKANRLYGLADVLEAESWVDVGQWLHRKGHY